MFQVIVDLLKILAQLVGLSKDNRISNLQKSFENLLLIRKEIGTSPQLDDKIFLLANSIAFGNGYLIPNQYSALAEKSPDPVKLYELFNYVKNYLTYTADSSFPSIKPHLDTKKKRDKFTITFTAVGFVIVSMLLYATFKTWPDVKIDANWQAINLHTIFDLASTLVFLLNAFLIFVLAAVWVPDRMEKLNIFADLLASINKPKCNVVTEPNKAIITNNGQ